MSMSEMGGINTKTETAEKKATGTANRAPRRKTTMKARGVKKTASRKTGARKSTAKRTVTPRGGTAHALKDLQRDIRKVLTTTEKTIDRTRKDFEKRAKELAKRARKESEETFDKISEGSRRAVDDLSKRFERWANDARDLLGLNHKE
ncbi:MAG: hypothetical protein JXR83_04450 [Deltaproteobacteria bacterium]|nr:hypothetical protein [Deltaproteobacteria bacterium]